MSVNFSYQSSALDYGSIWVSAIPTEGVSLEDIKQDIQNEFNNIIEIGVTEQEVTDAIRRLQDSAIFARDSLSGPARIFGYSLLTGSTIDDIENWPFDIATITSTQIQEVAKKYLSGNTPYIRPPVEGYLYPPKAQNKDQEEEIE